MATEQQKYKLQASISWQMMKDILYIFDEKENEIYVMENISAEIFYMIIKKISVQRMVDQLSIKYAKKKEDVLKDTDEFIEQLIDLHLIMEEENVGRV